MDTILKRSSFRRVLILPLLLLLLTSTLLEGQSIKYNFKQVLMDSTWNGGADKEVMKLLNHYQPMLSEIMDEELATSEVEMRSGRPQSLLSNFTTDAMLEYTNTYIDGGAQFALTNFGGLRATLPKGVVKRYDLFSIFPFENYLVTADLTGTSLLKMLRSFASDRVEALSKNVELIIYKGELKSAKIDGEKIDPKGRYRVVTIDFLIDGGDKVVGLNEATNIDYSDIRLRDAMIEMVTLKSSRGERLNSTLDKRVVIE